MTAGPHPHPHSHPLHASFYTSHIAMFTTSCSRLLTLQCCRHGIESAEIVPAVDSDWASGDGDAKTAAAGIVFVKTVIFQVRCL